MSLRRWLVLACFFACGCAPLPPSALGDSPTRVEGFVRELTKLRVQLADGSTVFLETLITRPDHPGRFPLVIVSHGSPREREEVAKVTPTHLASQSLMFARRGYAVAVVIRRGYGFSEGTWVESSGPCERKDYVGSTRAAADDVLAALRRLQGESWVDPDRVVLVGVSTGGFTSLAAAASNPRGVLGVVSFAGGKGSDVPDHVCRPDRLVAAAREFGSTSHVPSLWIYAQNDHFFDPVLAAQMEEGYVGGGGVAELVIAPAYGEDGHMFFARAPGDSWWQYVGPFLAKLGLPTDVVRAQVTPALDPPRRLGSAGRAAFAEYLASESFEKAFAAGASAYGWATGRRTRAEAAEDALRRCSERAKDCVLYTVGDAYAR
jgi:dienelactone hydrolase